MAVETKAKDPLQAKRERLLARGKAAGAKYFGSGAAFDAFVREAVETGQADPIRVSAKETERDPE